MSRHSEHAYWQDSEDPVKEGSIRKLYCNTCSYKTNHELKALHHREVVDGEGHFDNEPPANEEWNEWEYFFWICRGCETATLQEISIHHWSSHSDVVESEFYPVREKGRLPFKYFRQLDKALSRIYREVITAFNSGAPTLCAVGLRALLEGVCAEKGIEGRSLVRKLDGMEAYLPANIVKSLHRFRFMGNEAAHELQAPSEADLRLAIEVMEDLLNFMYELDYKATRLFEGGIADSSDVRPSLDVIRRIIERQPTTRGGRRSLYEVLYKAGDHDLSISQTAEAMGYARNQVFGVLGALGRRINNTPGVEGNPGIGFVLQYVEVDGISEEDSWGWKMRPELREALRKGNYEWAKDWAK